MHLFKFIILIIGPFKDQKDRFPYPFKYFNPWNPFIYLKRETLSLSEMPVDIGHYREYNPQGTDDTPLLYLETLLLPNSTWTVCAPLDLNLHYAMPEFTFTFPFKHLPCTIGDVIVETLSSIGCFGELNNLHPCPLPSVPSWSVWWFLKLPLYRVVQNCF